MVSCEQQHGELQDVQGVSHQPGGGLQQLQPVLRGPATSKDQGEPRGLQRGGVQDEGDVHGHPWSEEDVPHPGVGQFGPIGDGFAQVQ